MEIGAVVGRAAKYLLIGVVVVYGLDWGVFRLRMARGTGMGSVAVEQYMKIPLKGSKEEYDYLGSEQQSCAWTLFPQYAAADWNPPCWWLTRHRKRWQTVSAGAATVAESSPLSPASR